MRAPRAWMAMAIGIAFITSASTIALAATEQKIGVIGAANPATSSQGKEGGVQRTLQVGNDVFFEDMITTDAKGSAQIMFVDRSALTVGPNSSLKIDKFVYDPATSSGELTLKGTKGVFRFVGGALSKKEPVKIKTPVATIGIRGGIVLVDVAPNGATTSTMVFGDEMTMQNQNGDISRTTQPGMAIDVKTPTTPPSAPYQVDSAQLNQKVQQLAPDVGTNGGATEVPTSEDIQESRAGEAIVKEGEAAPAPTNPSGTGSDGEIKLNENESSSETQQAGTGEGGEGGEAGTSSGSPIMQQVADNQPLSPAPLSVVENNASQLTTQISTNPDVVAGTINADRTKTGGLARQAAASGTIDYPFRGRYMMVNEFDPYGFVSEQGTARLVGIDGGLFAEITETSPNQRVFYENQVAPFFGTSGFRAYGDLLNVGGILHTSYAYGSARGNMFFYHDIGLNEYAEAEQVNMVMGRVVPVSALPTAGVQGFYILPQLELNHFNPEGLHQLAAYYSPSNQLLPVTATQGTIGTGKPGMYINWATDTFLGGVITEEGTAVDGLADTVAFMGKIDRNNAFQTFQGAHVNFMSGTVAGTGDLESFASPVQMLGGNLYGAPGQLDGGLLEVHENGQRVSLPVMTTATAPTFGQNQTQVVSNGVAVMQQGFAAGFMVQAGSPNPKGFHSLVLADVQVQENPLTGSAGARLSMQESGVNDSWVHAWFGTMQAPSGSQPSASASIAPGVYGAQQNALRYTDSFDPSDKDGPGSVVGGAITASDTRGAAILSGAFAPNVTCTQCRFVQWGVWAGEVNSGTTGSPQYDVAHMVYYVHGKPTLVSELPATTGAPTNAQFSGIALAAKDNGSTISHHHDGTFNATVNFNLRQVNNLNINIPSANLSASQTSMANIATSGPATFSGFLTGTLDGNSISGSQFRGALFGPRGAGIGGNFNIQDSSGTKVNGVYLGGCGTNCPTP